MLVGYHPVFQALLGTLFTWGLTAAGSGFVFIFSSGKRKVLDGSLGFAAGVMTAASYWSLLAPAIELAETSGFYGAQGQWAFVPCAIGFVLGAVFVHYAENLIPLLGVSDPTMALALGTSDKLDKDAFVTENQHDDSYLESSITIDNAIPDTATSRRRRVLEPPTGNASYPSSPIQENGGITASYQRVNWKRIMLLIIAITIHNIPEGLAVGVGFGAIGKTSSATFENARNLAIGIGIQNFPEGLAVSLPLRGSGMSVWRSFWYGQLSGMVEPIAGVLGALLVVVAEPILPYALAFAAGAMIFVVFDDIIPESQVCGNGKLASGGAVVGFVVMMSLDVGLG